MYWNGGARKINCVHNISPVRPHMDSINSSINSSTYKWYFCLFKVNVVMEGDKLNNNYLEIGASYFNYLIQKKM